MGGMKLVAVVAMAENRVIGHEGELPWPSIPADKRQYRDLVSDDTVILGRRTFESMRDDLPGKRQLVLSRDEELTYPESHVTVVNNVDEALASLESLADKRAYVLGGGGIYEAFFAYLDILHVSRIPGRYHGMITFPRIDPDVWKRVEERDMDGFTLERWVRR